jgi:hypothetical protein
MRLDLADQHLTRCDVWVEDNGEGAKAVAKDMFGFETPAATPLGGGEHPDPPSLPSGDRRPTVSTCEAAGPTLGPAAYLPAWMELRDTLVGDLPRVPVPSVRSVS